MRFLRAQTATDHKLGVGMFCPFFLPSYGGAELATLCLTKELKELCDVELYTFNWAEELDIDKNYGISLSSGYPEQDVFDGVPIHRYSVTNLPLVKNFSTKLIRDLKSSDVDVVHFQGLSRLLSLWLTQKAVQKKVKILTTHGLQEAVRIISRSKISLGINYFFSDLLKSLDHIIALSKTDVSLLSYLGVNKDKITLIPNGIDESKFEKRRGFVDKNKKLKILCVARFDRNKNYESLIYALQKLKDDLDFEAYFVGSPSNREYLGELMTLIEDNKLAKYIKIGLSLDDAALVDCYLSCDLFVLPSTAETSPLVILEAMYAGLPVIATHVGSIPYMIKDGVNGFIIPKNDPVKLYETCVRLLRDENTRKEMGRANRQMATKYTWSKAASSTYTVYENLCMRRHRA